MQNQILKLKEAIWELTGACKNHCSYCGSKECWDDVVDKYKIIRIAEAIAKYPPQEINISGGDPLLVSYETHKTLTDILIKAKNDIKLKLICNPKSFQGSTETYSTLDLYDWVGISVNVSEELEIMKRMYDFLRTNEINYTIISNFNIKNLYIFDKIKKFVKENNLLWQIQYTVYELPDHPMAIYNDNDALAQFNKAIETAMGEGVKIVLADNMNSGSCGAGHSSIGILADGTVVPCLSMRSWVEDIRLLSQGNILAIHGSKDDFNTLKDIWETKFLDYRFKEFRCCKDHCNNKAFCPSKDSFKGSEWKWVDDLIKQKRIDDKPLSPSQPPMPNVFVYGVVTPSVAMYAVQIARENLGWNKFTTTTTTYNSDNEKKDKQ